MSPVWRQYYIYREPECKSAEVQSSLEGEKMVGATATNERCPQCALIRDNFQVMIQLNTSITKMKIESVADSGEREQQGKGWNCIDSLPAVSKTCIKLITSDCEKSSNAKYVITFACRNMHEMPLSALLRELQSQQSFFLTFYSITALGTNKKL